MPRQPDAAYRGTGTFAEATETQRRRRTHAYITPTLSSLIPRFPLARLGGMIMSLVYKRRFAL
jgi:hypothetical protein